MRFKYSIILYGLLTLCQSCSVYKPFQSPLAEPQYELEDSSIVKTLDYKTFFADSLLQNLIQLGLKNNADYLKAELRIKQAKAAMPVSYLGYLPSLRLTSDGSVLPSSVGASVLKASWELDLRGKAYNNVRQSSTAVKQSEVYKASVQTELIASIANLYYSLQMLDAQYIVSKTTSDNWKQNVRIMRSMKEAGMTNEASVSQTEANSYSIDASLYDLKKNIQQTENALALLLGVEPQAFERGTLGQETIPYVMTDGVPVAMLAARPDVKSAELALRQAFYGRASAASNFYPQITISGLADFQTALNLLYGLVQPLFNAGSNVAAYTIARSKQEEAFIDFKQSLIRASVEVNDAVALGNAALGKIKIRANQIESLQSAVTSTQQLMRHSESTYLEVLTAQQSLLNARLQQIQDKQELIRAKIALFRALGGGYPWGK